MSDVDDLVTWLRAQLDEDERVARQAQGGWITLVGPDPNRTNSVGRHMARHDPARVLAEVEAKRSILDTMVHLLVDDSDPMLWALAWRTVRLLALPYADRPGYRAEWAPGTVDPSVPARKPTLYPRGTHPALLMPAPKGYRCPVCQHSINVHREHGCDVDDCDCPPRRMDA